MDSASMNTLPLAVQYDVALARAASAQDVEFVDSPLDVEAVPGVSETAQSQDYAPNDRPTPLLDESLQLLIEPRQSGHGYMYSFIDRQTGEVVRVWPPERLVEEAKAASADVGRTEGLVLDRSA